MQRIATHASSTWGQRLSLTILIGAASPSCWKSPDQRAMNSVSAVIRQGLENVPVGDTGRVWETHLVPPLAPPPDGL